MSNAKKRTINAIINWLYFDNHYLWELVNAHKRIINAVNHTAKYMIIARVMRYAQG